jgi:XRE family transcriptional regulator, fatty acid utilization regulator
LQDYGGGQEIRMTIQTIGPRLKALRKARALDQGAVAAILGVASHQIVSQIESGARRVTGEELVKLIDGLDTDLDYFTDPFRLEGEGRFSWRRTPGTPIDALADYQMRAGRWIAAYRALARPMPARSSARALPLMPPLPSPKPPMRATALPSNKIWATSPPRDLPA